MRAAFDKRTSNFAEPGQPLFFPTILGPKTFSGQTYPPPSPIHDENKNKNTNNKNGPGRPRRNTEAKTNNKTSKTLKKASKQ